MPNWVLPESIADILPSEARQIEDLRRQLLDQFQGYGYELVMPPMLEYLESLLTGAGQDTNLRTFKLVDQLSGRTMGVRADMTTQVARIDAHLLNRAAITRLCYAGTVLRTLPSGLHATREPFQIGAEIYGHAGLEADIEIQALALASLAVSKLSEVRLDLCHVGVLRALIADDPIAKAYEAELFALLGAKDVPGLREIASQFLESTQTSLLALTRLYGDVSVLAEARRILPQVTGVPEALNELEALAKVAEVSQVTIDLADLRGYHYHSGVMFALYVPGLPNAVARGGRYNHVGEAFGRSRPATGFSMDLRELARLMPDVSRRRAICAPWGADQALRNLIAEWRRNGEIVIQSLPGQIASPDEFDCDRVVVSEDGHWLIKNLD
ncbi:MAG: ATP phosphoribosyltransferase regulatory subunit [Herbaspirillum sp.]